jgi:hypothetical protein
VKRRLIFAVPFVGIIGRSIGTAEAQGPRWTEYKTDDGRFRVQMPGTPTVQNSATPMGGNETAPTVEATVRTPAAAYQLTVITYPRKVAMSASADVILDHFRNNLTAGHTYRNEKPLTVGRAPGREFLMVESSGRNTAVRLFWSRGRLYGLMAVGGAGIETRPDTRKFLDSFETVPT